MSPAPSRAVALLALAALLLAANPIDAHMEVTSPPPRGSKLNTAWIAAGLPIDYTNTAPLDPSQRPLACGKPKGPSVRTVNAGETVTITIGGGAPHGGGHCQFSLGYSDNVNNWVVLDTILDTCIANGGTSYPVTIPATAPDGEAVLSWTWINRQGNREIYQNCIDITLTSGGQNYGKTLSGSKVVIGNYPGYPTFPEGLAGTHQYYDNAGSVSGVGPSGSSTPSTPANAPKVVDPVPTSAPAAPAATTSDAAAPTATYTPPAAPSTPAYTPTQPAIPSVPSTTDLTGTSVAVPTTPADVPYTTAPVDVPMPTDVQTAPADVPAPTTTPSTYAPRRGARRHHRRPQHSSYAPAPAQTGTTAGMPADKDQCS